MLLLIFKLILINHNETKFKEIHLNNIQQPFLATYFTLSHSVNISILLVFILFLF